MVLNEKLLCMPNVVVIQIIQHAAIKTIFTGKTYLLNALLAEVRTLNDEKNIAIAVASSGVASLLLKLGRTFHSRFKVTIKKKGK